MKKILIVLSFTILYAASAYSTTTLPSPVEDKLVYSDEEVSFTMQSNSALIVATDYNETAQFFSIETEETINFLQVVNQNGEIEYQLPIGSKVLKLALEDFEPGTHQINLLIEGEKSFVTTELVKKM